MRKFGVLLVLSLFLSFACGYVIGKHANTPQIEAHTDTFVITRVDTVIDTLLIPKYIKIKETIRDTLYVPELSKPAEVEIPISEYCFEDSTYSICMTGYKVKAKKIEVYSPVKYLTITKTETHIKKKKSHFSLGLQAGYGYAISCNKFSPYLGFGAQWNFLTF